MCHSRQYLKAGCSFKITCSQPIVVLVMSDTNLLSYNSGRGANYYGGFFTHFPAILEVPCDGHWNVLLETREFPMRKFQYSIDIIHEKEVSEI
ncbi:DUF1883 domain-containing protein [Hafnia alvei]|uniref:DUF1883 domain-containing protein n=1 Tax=Hafnia alvei TaxID=569 RepID=A0ABD7Q512_HAFAL|nr:DUF1883 domain-containing protein [Hafnia alvei]TBL68304.1 DUF1883 domain-containing protein [Hafnia alvei]